MTHYVIYLPGLHDHKWRFQFGLVQLWRIWGVEPYGFPLNWYDTQSFASKFNRLLELIDELYRAGNSVSLVGVSAGASVAVNAFAARPRSIRRVVLLCGKIQHPETVNDRTYVQNPSFKESMATVGRSLASLRPKDLARITSVHPLYDETVPVGDTIISGAVQRTIPVAWHVPGILFGLTIGSWLLTRYTKK